MIAVGGGVQTPAADERPYVTRSTPYFSGPGSRNEVMYIASMADGTYGAPVGWHGSAVRGGGAEENLAVAVVCGDVSDVKTVITSRTINEGTRSGSAVVTCPTGYSAAGGGAMTKGGLADPYLTTSAPVLAGGSHIATKADGSHGAAFGWRIEMNWGEYVGLDAMMKIAVVCVKLPGMTTVITSAELGPPGRVAARSAACPGDAIALSGGVQAASDASSYLIGTYPVLPGGRETIELQMFELHDAPVSWKSEVERRSDGAAGRFKVAAICFAN